MAIPLDKLNVDIDCVLWHEVKESRNHLFFEYAYSKEVWFTVLEWCGIHRNVGDWSTELIWAMAKLTS